MVEQEELRGTMECPICGHDKPHAHSEEAIAAYRADQVRADGWISSAHRMPTKFGYYLIKDFKMPMGITAREAYMAELSRWRKPCWGDAPEVAEYHSDDQHWFRLLYKPIVNSRYEPGHMAVRVAPKFWRSIPNSMDGTCV